MSCGGSRPGIDVVVPSFGRPARLARCLDALATQSRPPARIVVAARPSDRATWAVAERAASRSPVVVVPARAGVVAALRAGVAATDAEVVAFTDDDALARPDWLARLETHFRRSGVGGVGGRDAIPGAPAPDRVRVGTWARFGRTVGDHHRGCGPARAVDVLKGVNMAFRAEALALPRAGVLEGEGAECHFEILVCWWCTQRGWALVYDPALVVDHRVDLGRDAPDGHDAVDAPCMRTDEGSRECAANWMIATTALDRRRWPVQVAYGLGFGSRESLGLGRAVLAAARGEHAVPARLRSGLTGQWRGARRGWVLARDPARVMVTAAELRARP